MSLSVICKWLGRVASALLLLLWGAFFVEHLQDWFLGEAYPPAWVWIEQGFHLVMLIGLAMMLRWDRVGTVVMAAGTIAFFSTIGMRTFPTIALLNLVPVAFFAVYWSYRKA